ADPGAGAEAGGRALCRRRGAALGLGGLPLLGGQDPAHRRPRNDPRPAHGPPRGPHHPQRRRHALQLPGPPDPAQGRRVARMVDAFLDWMARLPTPLMYAVLALLSAVENVFPPAPADVAVALGAFLAQRGALSAPLLGLVCWAANTASAV